MNEPTELNAMLDAMEDPKPWWQSRGIIGSVVTGAAAILALMGYTLDTGAATDLVVGLVGIVGAALSWWGRVQALHPISKTKILPGLTLENKS